MIFERFQKIPLISTFDKVFRPKMDPVFCFLSVLFLLGLTDADIRGKSFKYKDNHKADGPRDILQNLAVSSISKCAFQCTANKDCDDANFDKVSKFCQLLRKKTENVMLSLVEQTAFTYLGDDEEIKNYEVQTNIMKENSSCKSIYDSGKSTGSKAYNLTFGMSTDWSMTYCMMDPIPGCGPGGWTLVMKIDGAKQVFTYDSPKWSEKTAYNEGAGRTGIEDLTETKMPAYWKTNFTKICLGMRRSTGNVNWMKIDMTAESLYSLLADNTEKTTALGKPAWESLFPDHVLQEDPCNEGFNVDYGTRARVRIGFVADNNDCPKPNSGIGVGVQTDRKQTPCGSSIDYSSSLKAKSGNCFIFVQ